MKALDLRSTDDVVPVWTPRQRVIRSMREIRRDWRNRLMWLCALTLAALWAVSEITRQTGG